MSKMDGIVNNSLIKNRNRVRQVLDFTGVQNGNMHPSDIDAVLEFDGKYLILIEVKFKGTEIPTGQKLLLERIAESGSVIRAKEAVVLKVEHDFKDDSKNIPLDKCIVTELWAKTKKWEKLKTPLPFIEVVNKLGEFWECKKCKF